MVFSKLLSSYRAFRSDFTLGGFERYYRTVRYVGMGAVVLTLGAYFFGTSHQSYLSTDHIARVNVGHVVNPQAGWLAALDSALSNARARAIVLVIDPMRSLEPSWHPQDAKNRSVQCAPRDP